MVRNEILWKQKSRELWLREGDKNSKFFHLSTVIQRKKNHIEAIKNDSGKWLTSTNDIKSYLTLKFSELYSAQDLSFLENLDNLLQPCITQEENDLLRRCPTPEEIKSAIFEINPLKSPGPDGMPGLFFKHYWHIVGDQVIAAVRNFFIHGQLLGELNQTFIVLIPKIINPSSISHFRPISLCNVVYKSIAKILVNRLRPLLHKLISPQQSAFVPNRWIAENAIVVQELIHTFKKKRNLKVGMVGIKVDLQKAYDRVDWNFLMTILKCFGFCEKFSSWIFKCIAFVSYTLLINGSKSKSFHPSRGLRQGDPLSPYLFIICQEVLSRLIDREMHNGAIKGVKADRAGPPISHLMHANDLVLFCKAKFSELSALERCLMTYCEWSGQLVNRDKSGFFCV